MKSCLSYQFVSIDGSIDRSVADRATRGKTFNQGARSMSKVCVLSTPENETI